MVPELNGIPILFTKKTSKYPNKPSVEGRSNLNINNKIAIEIPLAIMKELIEGLGFFFEKINHSNCGDS